MTGKIRFYWGSKSRRDLFIGGTLIPIKTLKESNQNKKKRGLFNYEFSMGRGATGYFYARSITEAKKKTERRFGIKRDNRN